MLPASRAWSSSKVPVSASASCGILTRIRPLASSASACGSRSQAISAPSIARAEAVFRLEATDESLIEASSSISSSLVVSLVRSPISCTR
jgi:hypothetical protein